MWLTDFNTTEEEDMQDRNIIFPDNAYKNPPLETIMKPELESVAKMAGYHPQALVNDTLKHKPSDDVVPVKYQACKEDWYKMAEWRSMWRFEKKFEENYPVSCQLGFDTDTNEMRQNGWSIILEFNRATGKRKLAFRHDGSGLMVRVPFNFSDAYIDIPMFYAVKNYKLVPAKFKETIVELTEDMIPDLLEWIREVKKAKVSDFVCSQKEKQAKEKVVQLGNYLHNQQTEAA